ncbi:hypothetical protein O3M35_009757 [Rhynocoris fuscipes]|uniref:Uncharacterized protein n=1 Tax=Rhynocoris fuscipes TaxID=488301 RepID=A0AAW1D9F4_9HEMI
MQKVASEYMQTVFEILTEVCLCNTHTHTRTEKFLLHFWNQEPLRLVLPLRKVYVRKKNFLTQNNTFLLLCRLERKKKLKEIMRQSN